MESQTAKNPITEGVIWKQLLFFFFPILLGTFFQQLYNTVDTVVVGQFVGKEALASVGGSAAQIVNLVVGFFTGLSSGASITIAQFVGAKDRQKANEGLHNAYAIAVAGGIILTIAGILLTPFLLNLMNTPADTMQDSAVYLRIYFGGILFVLIYNMGASILRATGDSRRPLYYLIVCCLINIVLDLLFVVVFHLGVMGVAIATLIAQAVSACLVTRRLMLSEGLLELTPGEIRFHKKMLGSQLKMGLPTGFESILFSITNIAILSAINTFGTDTVAAWSAFGKLDAIFWMISTAFGISITTFVGQNYGAGKMDRVRKSTLICLAIDLVVSAVLVVLLVAGRELLFRLFISDASVIEIGAEMLRLIMPWYVVYVFIEVLAGSLRGVGDVIVPVIITLFGVCLLRIVWIIGVMHFSPTIPAIIYSYPVTWVLTALAFIVYYIVKNRRR
ncbi:MATE family efflux transporter [Lachnoclostridium sp. An169]|uniref:MATE family efflux transporter n=1 Tax=Lachnoclostridium sp. An169 TaxID=1965569 RepID=UPI000B3714DF|nr:MATE family efflux transporter [Lachnoclostridium sp. An169]OUP85142.1 MATE family efflux transporter [Lachnoclostridium sp. An169]HJA64734.1 MATE family efflux transporter [Candidatus Mediterraneibacter cottocaccae]